MNNPVEPSEALLLCPFCKSPGIVTEDPLGGWVECSNGKCGASGPSAQSDAWAVTAWNTRAAMQTAALNKGPK